MFDNKDGEWFIHDTDKKVAIVHQDYFRRDHQNRFSSIGTNWNEFHKVIMNLIVGNPVTIKNAKLQGK